MRKFDGTSLVIASHNVGKLRETGVLLQPFGLEVRSAADFGLEEPEETESTFNGNARIKHIMPPKKPVCPRCPMIAEL